MQREEGTLTGQIHAVDGHPGMRGHRRDAEMHDAVMTAQHHGHGHGVAKAALALRWPVPGQDRQGSQRAPLAPRHDHGPRGIERASWLGCQGPQLEPQASGQLGKRHEPHGDLAAKHHQSRPRHSGKATGPPLVHRAQRAGRSLEETAVAVLGASGLGALHGW